MEEAKKVIATVCGSLRRGSYNHKVLEALEKTAPAHWEIEHTDISGIPLYDADLEKEGDPLEVSNFKRTIERADGVVIVTPEYNTGIPGVLKNALDWASRPAKASVMIEKPFAVAGATPGNGGTAQSQMQVRQTLLAMNAYVMPGPKIQIRRVHEKIGETTGVLEDERTLKYLNRFLSGFEGWVETLRKTD